MIVFELTMPHVNTWNGRWSGENERFIRIYPNKSVPKEYVDRDFEYYFSDGWVANIHISRTDAASAHKLENQSCGFMGYDWMIKSILDHGKIEKPTWSLYDQ